MAFFEAIKSKAKTQSKTMTAGTSATTVMPDSGYEGLSDVTVNPTPSQEKTVTSSRDVQTVMPDSGKLLSKVTVNALAPSGTYAANSRGAALDMGATSNYRYVNTNNVPNYNSDTYTFASGDTGGTKDLGATNAYRYVNAANVYEKGKADASGINIPVNTGFHIPRGTVATSIDSISIVNGSASFAQGVSVVNKGNYSQVVFNIDAVGMYGTNDLVTFTPIAASAIRTYNISAYKYIVFNSDTAANTGTFT